MCVYIYVRRVCVCMCLCMYVCMYVRAYECMYVCMYKFTELLNNNGKIEKINARLYNCLPFMQINQLIN